MVHAVISNCLLRAGRTGRTRAGGVQGRAPAIHAGGKAAAKVSEAPVLISNAFGRGRAVLFNFHYAQNVLLTGGSTAFIIPFALNDAPGRWTLVARDVNQRPHSAGRVPPGAAHRPVTAPVPSFVAMPAHFHAKSPRPQRRSIESLS